MSDRAHTDAQRDQMLGRIDGNVERLLVLREADVVERKELAVRVTSLEKYRWLQTGAAGALGALVSALFGHRLPF